MKKELIKLFSPFGPLQNVITKKRLSLRGQAFIIFKQVSSAQKALNALQNHLLFYKPLHIEYCHLKSYVHAKEDNTFEEVRSLHEQHKLEKSSVKRLTKKQYRAQLWANQTILPEALQGKMAESHSTTNAHTGPLMTMTGEISLPNKILFIQNISASMEVTFLESLFKSCSGFVELRLIPTKKDIAFVEFINESAANTARLTLDHYPAGEGFELHVSFAKK